MAVSHQLKAFSMSEELTLKLTNMAHGGSALGRDENGRVIFVPRGIPGETVRVAIVQDKKRFAQGQLLAVLEPADSRIEPRCGHFAICGGCHFQHIDYEAQKAFKRNVVIDQLNRLGGLAPEQIKPVLSPEEIWNYNAETSLSPVREGGLGFWSPTEHRVFNLETCHVMRPALQTLLEDIDLELPGLRKLTLRVGDDEAMLAAFEINGVEPPSLEVDFPLSITIVLPDKTTANLIGDNFVIQQVGGKDFRVTSGCAFPANPSAASLLVEQVQILANLSGTETVLDLYSGVGLLGAFLADGAGELVGIEQNPDAILDASTNLSETENVALYEGKIEHVLPGLEINPDVVILDPPTKGVPKDILHDVATMSPDRIVYVSTDVANLARDGAVLQKEGYRPVTVQPIDMQPHHFQITTVSLWELAHDTG